MKEKILKLRNKGLTYAQICDILGCSKSTVSYHLNDSVRSATLERTKKRKYLTLEKKISRFKSAMYHRIHSFGAHKPIKEMADFNVSDLISKYSLNTVCYLTGRKLNLLEDSFHLDHIIPTSRGGDNTISNVGITCPEANMAKSNMTPDELIQLCKEILVFNGYTVEK